jgi:predicted PurR-regulated permease PerM
VAIPFGEWVVGGASIALFGFLLYFLREVLNPFLVFIALVATMVPLRRTRFFWPIVGPAFGLTFFWLLSELGSLLAPFILGLVAAYILSPLVDRLSRLGFIGRLDASSTDDTRSRTVAIFVLCLPLIAAIVGLFAWGVPALAREMNDLLSRVPELMAALAASLRSLETTLMRMRVPGIGAAEWVERIQNLDEDLVEFLQARSTTLIQGAWTGVLGLGRGIGTLFSLLGYAVLTPVIAFYLMRDYGRLALGLDGLIPPDRTSERSFLREYDQLLSSYLRGQVTVALLIGLLTGVGLWIAQFPYALLLGSITAVLGLVPYLGLVLSLVPAVAIALTSGAVGISLLKVAIVFGVTQGLEGAVISPRVLGGSTGLHPVWILMAIALGGFFFGFVGLLIAVPVAAGLKLLISRSVDRYRASAFFQRSLIEGAPEA